MASWAAAFGLLLLLAAVALAAALLALGPRRSEPAVRSLRRARPGAADAYATEAVVVQAVQSGAGEATGGSTGFVDILAAEITSSSGQNRVYATFSAQTAIGLESLVSTGAAGPGSTLGLGSIEVQVLVDGVVMQPGPVIFDSVVHPLSVPVDPVAASEELLALTEANAFTFILRNPSAGTHSVVAQARLTVVAEALQDIGAAASAALAQRSLVVKADTAAA